MGVIIEDVEDNEDMGSISEPRIPGGLPCPDIEVPEIEGDSEYERPSLEREGTLMGTERVWDDEDGDGPYICVLRASFSLLNSSF